MVKKFLGWLSELELQQWSGTDSFKILIEQVKALRYGLGVKMVNFQKTHKQLKNKFGLNVSFLKEYWGEMWDSYSPENGYQNVDFD